MNIQNIISKKREIYSLAEKFHTTLKKEGKDMEINKIIVIILIIILINFPEIRNPNELNTMLIRIINNNGEADTVREFTEFRPTDVIVVKSPVIDLETYFSMMKDHLENMKDKEEADIKSINATKLVALLQQE
jgi:hypothetical protein